MSTGFLTTTPGTVRVRIRLQPRASHNRIVGWHGQALKAQVTAPPVEGEANAALVRLVARAVELPPSAVRVVGGAKSREKLVEIETVSPADVAAQLERLAGGAVRVDKPEGPD
ncbi:MAG: DUF167 domain-containing protein [Deltaproteobacteria bacterium]|nr:DUF167 domain-containing protein [Deltaproteobacteria bacterium]